MLVWIARDVPESGSVEEDCVSKVVVDDEVVTVIQVPDVTGVDEVLLSGGTVDKGITPTEERLDDERGLLVVFL